MEGLSPPLAGPVQHLYVHIPFCHRICPYCSFHKHLPGHTDLHAFTSALVSEATHAARVLTVPPELRTVYFGGGTPTFLSTAHLARLLPELRRTLDFSAVTEWTMEVNPRTISPDKARLLRDEGVTRASLGVQAWDVPTLTTLGRDHAPDQAREAFSILRDAGFPAVNIDLIFSVPGQDPDTWRSTLTETLRLQPDHVSAYNLTYEEDTEFYRRLQQGQMAGDEDRDAECFTDAMAMLEAAGYAQYEISNYAPPGQESRHNAAYWSGADYLGLGPGAVSTVHGQRWTNAPDTTAWMHAALAGTPLHTAHEEIDTPKWRCERIALGLRTREGLDARLLAGAESTLAWLESGGFLCQENGRVLLTRAGRFVADRIASALWESL